MKHLVWAAIILAILLFIVWKAAVVLISLGFILFKVLLIFGAIVFFWFGWKMRGYLEEHRKGMVANYFSGTMKN